MEPKLQQQIDELEIKVAEIHTSVKKTERYMKWTFWGTVALVVVPMIIAVIILPIVLKSYLSMFEGVL